MADSKITSLTEKATGAATDEFVINDVAGGNVDKKLGMDGIRITESQISDLQAYLLNVTGEPLSDLSDVTITSIASGEIIKWNGSAWINNTLAEAGISATGHTHTESDITDLQSYLVNIVEDTTPQLGGNLDGQGNDLTKLGTVSLTEQAAANADVAGDGQFWVKTETPNIPMFTDDAGTDTDLQSYIFPKGIPIKSPNYTLVEGFQSGHGFTLASGNGTFSDDTTDYFVGSQGLKLVTPGDGVSNLINLDGITTQDGNGKHFALAVKCDDWSSIGTFTVQLGHNDGNKFQWTYKNYVKRLPNDTWVMLPMAILQTPTFSQSGYMFSKTGSPIFTAMDFLKFVIADDAVGTPTIRIGGFFSFPTVKGGRIILRHDDNKESHWTKAMPYLNEKGLKGTFTLIPETMTDAYQLQMFAAQDYGHDVIMHGGNDLVDDITAGQVEGEIRRILIAATERGLKSPHFFNYPGGGQNDEIVQACKKYFRACLSGNNFPGTIPPTDPYSIPFMDGMSDTTADTIAAIDDCMNNDCLCVISVHTVVDSSPAAGEILTASYETIVDHIANNYKDRVITLSELEHIQNKKTKEQWIPANKMISRTTNGAAISNRELATNDVMIPIAAFDTTTSEATQFTWTPPEDWNKGTVRFKMYWTNQSGTAAQTIDFDLAARAFTDDNPLDTAFGTAQNVTDTFLAQNDMHITSFSSAITIAGNPNDSKQIIFQLSRDVASDNLTGDAEVIGIVLEYGVTQY